MMAVMMESLMLLLLISDVSQSHGRHRCRWWRLHVHVPQVALLQDRWAEAKTILCVSYAIDCCYTDHHNQLVVRPNVLADGGEQSKSCNTCRRV